MSKYAGKEALETLFFILRKGNADLFHPWNKSARRILAPREALNRSALTKIKDTQRTAQLTVDIQATAFRRKVK